MSASQPITLRRACEVIEIPSGIYHTLPASTVVRIMQSLGSGYTVATDRGYMYRVDAKDADALGLSHPATAQAPAVQEGTFSDQMVWEQLKTVYDPEIPVNIVDLGLIYSCAIAPLEQGGNRAHIKMSMTAPGCGMGNVLKADVESKLSRLPGIKEVHVEVVFDPPWHPGLMSDAAKLQLGFDLDYGTTTQAAPLIYGERK
jgi:probable FeS assembly SUF system protein SufT